MNRDGRWIKVVLVVLGIIVIAGIAKVLLDPGLGSVDEARRVTHPKGFSIIPPLSWGPSIFQGTDKDDIRCVPDKSTGQLSSLTVTHFSTPPATPANVTDGTFQGQPATFAKRHTLYDWIWQVDFQRAKKAYRITVVTPIEQDVPNSPLMPFINSFRVERAAATEPAEVQTVIPSVVPEIGPFANQPEAPSPSSTKPSTGQVH